MAAPITVLHVEDDMQFAELTRRGLERESAGISIETVANADAAFDRIAADQPDCVVSDYQMPGPNGIEFLRELRSDYPDLPFILYTSKGSEAVASDAISAGVTDYIQKDATTEQYELLARRIEQAVARRRAERDYREIFEKVPAGLVVHDPETGEIVDANRRFCELLGHDHEDVIGMTVGDFSADEPPYEATKGHSKIQEAAAGEPQRFTWRDQTSDGETFPVEVALERTTIGGQERVLAFVRDLSDDDPGGVDAP
jgi:PAS domain S-box-containing protein